MIDGDQNVSLTVGGGSEITGIIKCLDNTVEMTIGSGSHANLSQFYCYEATIELIDWGTEVEMAVSQVIHSVCLKKGSVLKLSGNPQIIHMSLHSGSVIQQVEVE